MALHKITRPGSSPVTLARTIHPITPEVALWVAIRNSCRQLDFHNYKLFIDDVMTAGSMQRRELTKARPSDPQDPTDDETVLRDYQNAVERDAMHVDDDGDPKYSLLPFSGSHPAGRRAGQYRESAPSAPARLPISPRCMPGTARGATAQKEKEH